MDDLISRQAAIAEVHESVFEFFDICDDDEESPITFKDEQVLELNKTITTRIKNLPAAKPRKGRWSIEDCHAATYKYCCSECKAHHRARYDYCPTCGARMEGDDEEAN